MAQGSAKNGKVNGHAAPQPPAPKPPRPIHEGCRDQDGSGRRPNGDGAGTDSGGKEAAAPQKSGAHCSQSSGTLSVAVAMPVGGPRGDYQTRSIAIGDLTARQAGAYNRLWSGLVEEDACVRSGSGIRPVSNQYQHDAIRWLLDQIADELEKADAGRG